MGKSIEDINVGIEFTNIKSYPTNQPFHPSEFFPEYNGKNIDKSNQIYSKIRELLYHLDLDAKNYDSSNWNPFGSFINPGMTVFIKTNTVHHMHKNKGDIFSVIIHASILRPILDYICIALQGKGRIIIGDSQVYDADFDKAMSISGIKDLIEWYKKEVNIPIECFDLRINKARRTWLYGRWAREKIKQDPRGYQYVDLKDDSYFKNMDPKKLRIVIASYKKMQKHHSKEHHRYLFPKSFLESDVVINIPKLKTHRRTGITLAIKNFMGLSALKDCLPHFMIGSSEEGGDQYIHPSFRKKIGTWMHDRIQSNPFIPIKFFFAVLKKINWFTRKIIPFKDDITEAMWPGNDTVWRTLLDLNRAAVYADKDGNICSNPQRKYFCVLDGIIGGEGEGPLAPDPVNSGVLIAGFNPVAIDYVSTILMGFDSNKINLIKKALEDKNKEKALFFGNKNEISIIDNGKKKSIDQFSKEHNLHFKPHPAWVGYIERD